MRGCYRQPGLDVWAARFWSSAVVPKRLVRCCRFGHCCGVDSGRRHDERAADRRDTRPELVDPAVAAAVADAHRREWALVLAATVRITRDFDLAEECVQDAYARALTSWAADGVPASPGAWLTTVARHRALDLLRRQA